MKELLNEKTLFRAIVVAFVVYGIGFIARTSFVVEGVRYFSLFDDGMISMTYARNLAEGHGLVWNVGGEPIEGYTNTLWVLYMAVLHLLPVAESKISLLVQLTSLAALTTNLIVVRRIARVVTENSTTATLIAVVMTAFHYPLNNWALQGMEVGVSALIVSVGLLGVLLTFDDGRFRPWPYIALGVGVLVRPDMTVPLVAIGGTAFLADRENRLRHAAYAGGVLLLCAGGQTLFRLLYFGNVYPNTYYLKMTGYPAFLRITRGIYVYVLWIWNSQPILFLIPFAVLFFRRDRKVMLLLAAFAAVSAYSMYVGGDHWENTIITNRYLSNVMAPYFVLCGLSLVLLVRAGASFRRTSDGEPGASPHRRYLPWVIAPVVLLAISQSAVRAGELVLLARPVHVYDNQDMVTQALLLRETTTPEAKVAVIWAGAVPYFAHRTMIDLLGKSDDVVGRGAVTLEPYYVEAAENAFGQLPREVLPPVYYAFRPGNMKYDLSFSVDSLRPDVVLQMRDFWVPTPYMRSEYEPVRVAGRYLWYVRKRSPAVQRRRLSEYDADEFEGGALYSRSAYDW